MTYLQTRPRRFGERDQQRKPSSQSHIETQYRRIKRFFNWLVEGGHVDRNPFSLIPHPHVDDRTIPIVSEQQALNLLRLLDPKQSPTPAEHFRMNRNRAVLYLLLDTPARRNEIINVTLDTVDMDLGSILVMGKG